MGMRNLPETTSASLGPQVTNPQVIAQKLELYTKSRLSREN